METKSGTPDRAPVTIKVPIYPETEQDKDRVFLDLPRTQGGHRGCAGKCCAWRRKQPRGLRLRACGHHGPREEGGVHRGAQ